jgi:hypothetical protein
LSTALHEKAWSAVPQEKQAAGEPTPAASNPPNLEPDRGSPIEEVT